MSYIHIKNIVAILCGAALFSFGFVHFNMQNALGEGGFSGITLILYFALQWDPALLYFLLNIPMFLIGYHILGKSSLFYTLIGTMAVSVFIKVFQKFEIQFDLKHDLFLAALFAGLFIGLGLGIIFRYGGTTGGGDIIARIVHKYFGWSMGKAMFLFDALVIMLSWMTYLDVRAMMYTLVSIFIGAKIIDFVQQGAYSAKGIFIISNFSTSISNAISTEMERGVTILTGKGHFTNEQREILYCVVGRNEIVKLKNIVQKVDPNAFFTILDVHEVAGEGFTLDANKKPLYE